MKEDSDCSTKLTDDEKVSELVPNEVPRDRRKELKSPITSVELENYRSNKGMLFWLGMLIFPLASFNSRFSQQRSHFATIKDLFH